MNKQVRPNDYLEKGTKVHIITGGYKGEIVKTLKKKDQFGMPINVFRVKYTKKYLNRKYTDIKPFIKDINYASIELDEGVKMKFKEMMENILTESKPPKYGWNEQSGYFVVDYSNGVSHAFDDRTKYIYFLKNSFGLPEREVKEILKNIDKNKITPLKIINNMFSSSSNIQDEDLMTSYHIVIGNLSLKDYSSKLRKKLKDIVDYINSKLNDRDIKLLKRITSKTTLLFVLRSKLDK